jgi:hypothetical protein
MTNGEAVECVIQGTTLDAKPMAYRFLVNFAKDNELQVLGEMQRVGGTA